ncbi:glycosyltransferase family 2 protein [Paenibacillus solani]|uniref:glycosyltransferase family 2 protein n=1 Tax=Paenibacillus solani TaxID=1705565 RepID=UPI003D29B12B
MVKVQVLLSSYNGAAYVEEQIHSILQQQYPPISMLIRDDGSSDETPELLKRLEAAYPDRITVMIGNNVGVVASFFELLQHSDPAAEYICFCDQDDVWLEHKVESGVARLKSAIYTEVPAMLFTPAHLTDEHLNRLGVWPKPPARQPSFYNALYENIAIGATIMMNATARNLFVNSRKPNSSNILMHDWWFYLLVSAFGTVIYDHLPSMLYRQHSHNVVGGSNTLFGKLKSKWASFKRHTGTDLLRKQAQEFREIYGARLSSEKREQLDLFLSSRRSLSERIRYISRSKLYRQSHAENLLFKFFILIGFI